ncbi:MAG TPA: hypothetical protein VFM71_13575, partial [Gemmatimonadaceae bacterium]|nr:hypothetical protein [Gemmatimonadaceae bacterium]
MPINTDDATKPDYVRPEVVAASKDLTLIHALQGGPQAMWDASTTYIRQWKDEERATYDIRRLCEPCEGLFVRTLSASVGKLFAKPPQWDFPASETVLRAHLDNIDGTGTKADVALKEFAADCLGDGFGIILVDHPRAPKGVTVTAANEGALGLRPVWAFYERASVLSWHTATINNAEVLTRLVLREAVEQPNGFGVAVVEKFRELYVERGV